MNVFPSRPNDSCIDIITGAVLHRTYIRFFCNFLLPDPLPNTEQLPSRGRIRPARREACIHGKKCIQSIQFPTPFTPRTVLIFNHAFKNVSIILNISAKVTDYQAFLCCPLLLWRARIKLPQTIRGLIELPGRIGEKLDQIMSASLISLKCSLATKSIPPLQV